METTTPKIPNIVSPQQYARKRKIHYIIIISVIIIAPFLTFILPSRFGYPFRTQINVPEKIFGTYGNIFLPSLNEDEILRAKAYLYNRYRPGNCFGMPTVQNNFFSKPNSYYIEKYPKETKLLRTVYGIHAEEQLAQGVQNIQKIHYKNHVFSFTDGNCCSSTSYIISVKKSDGDLKDTVLYQKKHSGIPC